ncbi:MAG: PTS sugar transporter subunit IIA [Oscillospiraceae bacterium]|nr:PTS sugar transporter subunit IIA [Oscillospiraceae bacterium]
MTKVIVIGHAGYGSAMKRNINMLVGEVPDFIFVDFNEQDDLELLRGKITKALKETEDCDVLFACDLSGGSPFREAALICTEHENYAVVAGLNTSAYTDMVYSLDLTPPELAEQAAEVARSTIIVFSAGQMK